eukprot:3234778-Amphidinium_carterae.1
MHWPPPENFWDRVDRGRPGRGPLRHLKTLCQRLRWTPQPHGFLTPEGWWIGRRPEFEGIDGRTLKDMCVLANRNDHASRAVLNAACGGVWMGDRREKVFEESSQCPYCGEAEGSASHTLYDCPALETQRKQAAVPAPRDDIPACVRVLGLGTLFPCPLLCPEEVSSGRTADEVLFTDGSGRHSTEPHH